MTKYQVSLLNPKASKLLQDLADLDLIAIKQTSDDFQNALVRLRMKASANPPSLDEITKEVESVRAKRYGRSNG